MLNNITIYRLVLYVLIGLTLYALGLSLLGKVSPGIPEILESVLILLISCASINILLGKIFKAPINAESSYITALILALIVPPPRNLQEAGILIFVSFCAVASKFFIAINRKHLFNPAAFAVVVSGWVFGYGASWWIANPYMFVPVLIGGFLIVKKTQRWGLVLGFLLTYILLNSSVLNNFWYSPLLFFGFIMLTEPQTSPPSKKLQIVMGVLVGLIDTAPEMALLAGNIFAYIVSPKQKLILTLKQKQQLTADTYHFTFYTKQKLNFNAGQYLEWTIIQDRPDTRGNRRYFTIASSPTEKSLSIGIKIYPRASSFKKALMEMPLGGKIVASQLAGEFTLPEEQSKKLVFIAGGIGITPFRSMIKYLLDAEQKRDITLIFSNATQEQVVYKDIFDQAQKQGWLKIVYVYTDTIGYVSEGLIREQVSDFANRLFYISGPYSMVSGIEAILRQIGIKAVNIKTDFFPGYA